MVMLLTIITPILDWYAQTVIRNRTLSVARIMGMVESLEDYHNTDKNLVRSHNGIGVDC